MEAAAFTIEGTIESGPSAAVSAPVPVQVPMVAPTRAVGWNVTKRLVDVGLALLMLVLMLPALVVIALLIRLDTSGPVFFRQKRYGRDQKPFVVFKFRTMDVHASPEAHQRYIAELAQADTRGGTGLKKLTGDLRVTRVGAVLRRTSLDELPQLLNVLMGTMSIVGPRPAIDYELEHYRPEHYLRFVVKPGLTGLWQVSGRSELGFGEMLALDAEYAMTAGAMTDLQILARTPMAVLRGRTA